MNKTVALACVVSAALFGVGFMVPPSFHADPGPTAKARTGRAVPAAPGLADLFDPVKPGASQVGPGAF